MEDERTKMLIEIRKERETLEKAKVRTCMILSLY